MRTYRVFVLLALAIYIGSFFLIAVKNQGSDSGFKGYECALTTLTAPWGSAGLKEMHQAPLEFFSVLFSGWINPLFLTAVLVRWLRPTGRPGWVLLILVLLMFPACWIVFARAHLRPAAGYFVWAAAMVIALFSPAFSGQKAPNGDGRDIKLGENPAQA